MKKNKIDLWDCPYFDKKTNQCDFVDLLYYECIGKLTYYRDINLFGCEKIGFFANSLEEILESDSEC